VRFNTECQRTDYAESREAYYCILWHACVVVEGPELFQAVQAVVHLVLLQHELLKVLQDTAQFAKGGKNLRKRH
jgi:hypothetical protein